ncbi:MAG: hypothetical protein AABM67_21395 [Acidobacteriota bacterium]
MTEEETNVSYEIRVSDGKAGTDPEAPDWEVAELENGVVKDTADIYDNLTLAEANQIAGMWTKKKEEAEAATE